MLRRIVACLAAASALALTPGPADARPHGHGGGHGGGFHGGFHGGYHGGFGALRGGYYGGYGWGYPLGFGWGGYGLRGYGFGYGGVGYGRFRPYYGGYATGYYSGTASGYYSPPVTYDDGSVAAAPENDDAAHIQLIVPENAAVWVDDQKMTQTGTEREFVSPPLDPGKTYTWSVRVRWTNAEGKVVDETRPIDVRANDWWTVDFTKPAPKERETNPPEAPKR